MTTGDEIWRELSRIRQLLESASDHETRADLTRRRDELREQARLVALSNESTEALEAELSALGERWDRLQRMRIDIVQQSGGGAEHGIDNARDAMRINEEIDRSQGRAELEARIAAIRRILEDRDA